MSTENEEWRENSFNEENTGAGRDGNRSYNREGGEPVSYTHLTLPTIA